MSSVKHSYLFLLGVYLVLLLGHCIQASSVSFSGCFQFSKVELTTLQTVFECSVFLPTFGIVSLLHFMQCDTYHCGYTSHLMIDETFPKFLGQLNISSVELCLSLNLQAFLTCCKYDPLGNTDCEHLLVPMFF